MRLSNPKSRACIHNIAHTGAKLKCGTLNVIRFEIFLNASVLKSTIHVSYKLAILYIVHTGGKMNEL